MSARAEAIVSSLHGALRGTPPAGLVAADVDGFFERQRSMIVTMFERVLAQREAKRAATTPPELWTESKRTAANLAAMALLASKPAEQMTPEDRRVLLSYSGWGGLSISKVAGKFPAGFPVPEAKGLLHEYYTPMRVWSAVQRRLRPIADGLPKNAEGKILTLEPSAGIGRAPLAFGSWPELAWTLCEVSPVSSKLLRALYPEAAVAEGYAEAWFARNAATRMGSFGLIVANPPYGARGEAAELDPTGYVTKQAYVYFVERCAEFLAERGIMVQVIPTGFMQSRIPPFVRARTELLRRAHLLAAYRLPSQPEEGADKSEIGYDNFVVDVLFLQGRGGVANAPANADLAIVEGSYFDQYPEHVLGKPWGVLAAGSEDAPATGPKARRGYQVIGRFKGFPDAPFRPFVELDVEPFKAGKSAHRGGIARDIDASALPEDAPARLRSAVTLGLRADEHLAAVARGNATGAAGGAELVRDMMAWREGYGDPAEDATLAELARGGNVGVQRFLTMWVKGKLVASLSAKVETAGFQGERSLLAIADWFYRQKGGLPLLVTDLAAESKRIGLGNVDEDRVVAELWNAGWRLDPGLPSTSVIEPVEAYTTGDLWPKFDRAVALADGAGKGTTSAQIGAAMIRQVAELKKAIGWTGGTQIARESGPVQPWVPFDVLREFAIKHAEWPKHIGFKRADGLLMPDNVEGYGALDNTDKNRTAPFTRTALCIIGWANGDNTLYQPPQVTEADETGRQVKIPVNRLRAMMEAEWNGAWQEWLKEDDSILDRLEKAYNRRLRGYVAPRYPSDPLPVARWGKGINLHPYQNEGVRKLVANRCGLLAFDVGLGKTYSGIATLARARQEGWARRPALIVPNTIVWKWYRDIARCLPDYRILVVGADRKPVLKATNRPITMERARELDAEDKATATATGKPVEKRWRWRSYPDDPDTRALKWSDFQAGLYDVVIITYSAFARQQIDRSFVERYVEKNVAIRRAITLALDVEDEEADALPKPKRAKGEDEAVYQERVKAWKSAKLAAKVEAGEDDKKKPKKRTERSEAETVERTRAWVGAKLAPPKSWAYDKGIDWHQLGIDLLLVDEAQNFKNLFYSAREGSPDRAASKRAWALDFRCASVREHSGGAGVILLSATPMKNAATEFFNMLYLVNPKIWEQVGISDPESFVNLFAKMKEMDVTTGTGKSAKQEVVVGFNHLDALKGVVYRWATFKTAAQVGLKIPSVHSTMHPAKATEAQAGTFAQLFVELADIEERIKNAARAAKSNPSMMGVLRGLKMKKQGVSQRLYLCSVHPGLVDSSLTAATDGPKLVKCAEVVWDTRPVVCHVPPRRWMPEGRPSAAEPWITKGRKAGDAETEVLPPVLDAAAEENGEPFCLNCGHIIFAENIKVHYWLRELLVAKGVARERIAILNADEAGDLEFRQQIAEGFNGVGFPGDEVYEPPKYDVVIANAVAYEGIDLQRHTCAIHHIDVPWEPATLQQRNGRGVRQGNTFDTVQLHFYFVAGSNEKHRLDKIERKRGIMTSLFEAGAVATNTVQVDTVEGDDNAGETFGAFMPPAVRDRIIAANADEEKRVKEENERRTRMAANSTLRDALQITRRIVRASGDDEKLPALRADYDVELAKLDGLAKSLWPYPWHEFAHEALNRRGVDVFVPEVGPALFPDVVLTLRPPEDYPDKPAADRTLIVTMIDKSVVYVVKPNSPHPSALVWEKGEAPPLNGNIADGAIEHKTAEWFAAQFPTYRSYLTQPGNFRGEEFARHGEAFCSVLWDRVWPEWAGKTTAWFARPYIASDGSLGIDNPQKAEPGSGYSYGRQPMVLRPTTIPPTAAGWQTFLTLAAKQKHLKHTELADVAASWWYRDLPTGIVGAELGEGP